MAGPSATPPAALAPPPVLQLDLGPTFGVGYLSVAFSSMLYGVACLQTFQYFRSRKAQSDSLMLKGLVVFLLTLDTFHQATLIHVYYYYLVVKNQILVFSLTNIWTIPTTTFLTAIIAFTANSFLTLRVWRLSRNWFVTGICFALTIGAFACATVFHIREYIHLNESLLESEARLKTNGIVNMAFTAAADTAIMVAMAYYLLRNRTGFRKSNMVITKLLTLSITTGALSSLLALATLISYVANPDGMTIIFFNVLSAKVYDNAFLTLLNVRMHIAGIWDNNDSTTMAGVNTIPLSHLTDSSPARTLQTSQGQVRVMMERSVDIDDGSDLKARYSGKV